MDLRQLRHFVEVFERKNLSKAAEAIPLSQPALTRSMKTLEDQLGVVLFDRHARGATPTEAGERLYHHAKSILAECARAKRDASQPIGELSGMVCIGIGALFATRIFNEMISNFCKAYPKVKVEVRQGYYEDLIALLDLGQIEVAFINFPLLSLPDAMDFEPLLEIRTSVFAATTHPAAKIENPTMGSLCDYMWATVDQPHATDLHESLFLSKGIAAPAPSIKANSLSLLKSLVLSGDFIGLFPHHLFWDEIKSGEVVRLDIESTPLVRSAGLISRNEAFNRPVADALAKEIRKTVDHEGDVISSAKTETMSK